MARMHKETYKTVFTETQATLSSVLRSCSSPRLFMRYLVLGIVLPLVLVGCGKDEKTAMEPADIGAGKSVAEAQCAACHGLDGRSKAPGIPHLAAQVDRYLFESLLAYKEGKRTHAALRDMTKELSNAEIKNVTGYYASLPPLEGVVEIKPEDLKSPYEKGKAEAGVCARCHGDDGNSKTSGTPSLAGQQPLYFVSAVRAYLDGRRSISGKEMLRELSHVDIESLAMYYATQTPARRDAPAIGDTVAGEPLSARCGGCHGAQGVSHDTATPSLAAQDPQYLISAIKAYRDQSRRHDAMLIDDTDEEIANLAAFYATQRSLPAESKSITAQGLAEKCDRCHGAEVENLTMAVPKISGQDWDYLVRALRAYRDGKRGSSMMHRMSMPYSEAIFESIASLYANQPAR
jgi:cytochrome c553